MLEIINLNEKKNHVPEGGIEPMTAQISQNQGKLDLNAITTLPSRLLVQVRLKFVMSSIITHISLNKGSKIQF